MRFAVAAELAELQLVLENFFVLAAEVVDKLADRTLQLYHVVLTHNFIL